MTQQEFTARYSYNPKSDQLGSGGFGSVYKAYDNEEDCFVALKIAAVDLQHPELRLRNEVAKAEHLKHKNVARYDACYTFPTLSGEMDIAVMRYYEHGSLDSFMRRGDLTLDERYDILTQILEGIAYLHSHGIIHRDLKPQNVLIVHHADKYIPKITDFGISKQLEDGESSLVSNSVLGGTRSYASPEQLCERTLRKNTDLWSFGVIAYNMLLGELPFTTGTFSASSDEGRSEQLRQVLSGKLPEGINHISEPWQSVIRGCLVVDGEKRLQHAEDCLGIINREETPEVDVEVEPIEDEKTVIGDSAQEADEKTKTDDENISVVSQQEDNEDKPKQKKNRWWVLLLGLLLIGGGAWFIFGDNKGENTESEALPEENVENEALSEENVENEALPETSAPYRIGDLYNENGKQGVVFEVSVGGSHGKIVSLNETKLQWCTDERYKSEIVLGLTDENNGKVNTDKVMKRRDSYQYPAFVQCRNKGADWYLPAIEELKAIYNNQSAINSTLAKHGGTELRVVYWSSTEYYGIPEFCAWFVSMGSGDAYDGSKYSNYYVRAVSAF
ncbi:MAG: DUF1566 domain-containing protein [Rikenellaceae bacterium]|nr:DUF1566 domain-containing protein [Rikenellaceae bacterium]